MGMAPGIPEGRNANIDSPICCFPQQIPGGKEVPALSTAARISSLSPKEMPLPDTFGVTRPELCGAPGLAGSFGGDYAHSKAFSPGICLQNRETGEFKFTVGEGKSSPAPAALGSCPEAGEEQINYEGVLLHLRPLSPARAVWVGARGLKAPREVTKRGTEMFWEGKKREKPGSAEGRAQGSAQHSSVPGGHRDQNPNGGNGTWTQVLPWEWVPAPPDGNGHQNSHRGPSIPTWEWVPESPYRYQHLHMGMGPTIPTWEWVPGSP